MPQVSDALIQSIVHETLINGTGESVVIFGGPIGPPGPAGPQGPAGASGSGGEEEVPTFPVVEVQSSTDLAAGASINLNSSTVANTKTAKLAQVTISSSVACKWMIKKSTAGVDTTLDILFTSGNSGNTPSHEWEPPHRDYAALVGNGSNTFFRVTATNLDGRNAANVYATFFWDEVTS